MALSADPGTRRYTYADLAEFPDDDLRREILDGELLVNPSPVTRHQRAVRNILIHLDNYARNFGGEAFAAPLDVFFSDINVVEPDVLFVVKANLDRVEERLIRSAPDLVVEVSSPSTRSIDQNQKRSLYDRFGVPEFWFVDLEAERVDVYRLDRGYDAPLMKAVGEVLDCLPLPGFSMPVDEALGIRTEPRSG